MNLFELFVKVGVDDQASGKISDLSTKLKSGLTTAAKVATAALAAASAAVVAFGKNAVEAGKAFDKSMSQVVATMGYSVEELNDSGSEAAKTFQKLRDFAQEMGSTTVFSATEAADALNYMALAGYDAETSMRMLPNVLNLAASGGIELARASDMVTDAQSALGLTLDQTAVMVDQMAKTASKSNTSVAQLGEAILTIGGTAQFMSGGTDRLATVFGLLADNGIKGSEAGTHLRNMLLKLSAPTKDAAAWLDALNVSVFDAKGEMRDFQDIMGDMARGLSELSDEQQTTALSKIFNTRDIAAAQALIGTSTARWNELGAAIKDASGAAQAMADVQLDNLEGDITLFKSALEGAYITVSDQLTPALRQMVQYGSSAISTISQAFKANGLEGAMAALGTALSDGLNMVTTALPTIVDAGGQLLGALVDGIIDNFPTLVQTTKDIIRQIVNTLSDKDNLRSVFRSGIDMLVELANGLTELTPDLYNGVASIISNVISVLFDPQQMGKLLTAGANLIKAVFKGTVDAYGSIGESVANAVSAFIAFFKSPENQQDIKRGGEKLLSDFMGFMTDEAAHISIGKTAGDIMAWLITSIGDLTVGLLEAAGDIFDALTKYLSGEDWDTAANDTMKALAKGWEAFFVPTNEALNKVYDKMTEWFTSIDWWEVGKRIMELIVEGMRWDDTDTSWGAVEDSMRKLLEEQYGVDFNGESLPKTGGRSRSVTNYDDSEGSYRESSSALGGQTGEGITFNIYSTEGGIAAQMEDAFYKLVQEGIY